MDKEPQTASEPSQQMEEESPTSSMAHMNRMLKVKVQRMNKSLEIAEFTIIELKSQLKNSSQVTSQEEEELATKLADQTTALSEATKVIIEEKSIIEALKRQVELKQKMIDQLEEKCKELDGNLHHQAFEMGKKKDEIETLKSSIQEHEMSAMKNGLPSNYQYLLNDSKVGSLDNAELFKVCRSQEKELDKLLTDNENYRKRVKILEIRYKALIEETSTLTVENDELKAKLTSQKSKNDQNYGDQDTSYENDHYKRRKSFSVYSKNYSWSPYSTACVRKDAGYGLTTFSHGRSQSQDRN